MIDLMLRPSGPRVQFGSTARRGRIQPPEREKGPPHRNGPRSSQVGAAERASGQEAGEQATRPRGEFLPRSYGMAASTLPDLLAQCRAAMEQRLLTGQGGRPDSGRIAQGEGTPHAIMRNYLQSAFRLHKV